MRTYILSSIILITCVFFNSCTKKDEPKDELKEIHFDGQMTTYERGYLPHSSTIYEEFDTFDFWIKATLKNDSIYFTTANDSLIHIHTVLANINPPFNYYYRLTSSMRSYGRVKFLRNDSIIYHWSYAAPTGASTARKTFHGKAK